MAARDAWLEAELEAWLAGASACSRREDCQAGLVAYSPWLPLAIAGQAHTSSSADGTAAAAARLLLRDSRLHCLAAVCGMPLIDRTGTLQGPLRTAVLHPWSLPASAQSAAQSAAQAAAAAASGQGLPPPRDLAALSKDFSRLVQERADALLAIADEHRMAVVVHWEGDLGQPPSDLLPPLPLLPPDLLLPPLPPLTPPLPPTPYCSEYCGACCSRGRRGTPVPGAGTGLGSDSTAGGQRPSVVPADARQSQT